VARTVADGTAKITARVRSLEATVTATVQRMAEPALVSFKNEMLSALTKAGCNMGACHGSPSGKGGFRLSLRAYDPELDIMTLRSEYFARRTNIMEPASSLLLRKALMEVAHGGGKRLRKTDPSYHILETWIAEGMKLDSAETPDLMSVETIPTKRVLRDPADQQQIVVLGHFSDGTTRDLTQMADFTSSAESVGTVSGNGLVSKMGRGETAVLCRYL